MNFLKNIFKKKEQPITSYAKFWNWFREHEKSFFNILKQHENIEEGFFDKLAPKLKFIKQGIWYLAGMLDDDTAELILTADGTISNIVFVEELIAAAPSIKGWKFTALKPALDIQNVQVDMHGHQFSSDTISFYTNILPEYPDEIDICMVHTDMTSENKSEITQGVLLFLDNYLGELEFVINIDRVTVIAPMEATQDLIPVSKLKDFLTWRQKEFVEKYEGLHYDTSTDEYGILEAEFESGLKSVAVINRGLLQWEGKASHPWICILDIQYDGTKTNGMPTASDQSVMDTIEDEILSQIKDEDGYLYAGRETAKGTRSIYFACKDFRAPSKAFYAVQQKYAASLTIEADIFKDKYWQTLERFM